MKLTKSRHYDITKIVKQISPVRGKGNNIVTKIIFRLLFVLVILFNAIIILFSSVTGVDIYKKYGKQILIGISIFCGVIMAFYISLALLGIS